jgi:hypothetical protein
LSIKIQKYLSFAGFLQGLLAVSAALGAETYPAAVVTAMLTGIAILARMLFRTSLKLFGNVYFAF